MAPPDAGPAAPPATPSTRTSTRSLTLWSGRTDRGPLELGVDAAGDEAQGELAQRGQVRLGEEPVERDPRPAPRG